MTRALAAAFWRSKYVCGWQSCGRSGGAKCSAEMMCIQRLHANECVAGSDPHLDTNNVTDKLLI